MAPTAPGAALKPVLRAVDVSKSFGAVNAVAGVALDISPGERIAIMGENGAGKSTLMSMLAGLLSPDSGHVETAEGARIGLVHQELALVPDLTVAENLCLGRLPVNRARMVSRSAMRTAATEALNAVASAIDPDAFVRDLPIASRQYVEIAREVARDLDVLILDEPTAALTLEETDKVLGLLHALSAAGTAIVFISHRIPEIFALCERAAVMRDGHLVADVDLAEVTSEQLVEAMVGRHLDLKRVPRQHSSDDVALRCTQLTSDRIHGVSLDVTRGEILGIGGLIGSGRTELLRLMAGLDRPIFGRVDIRSDGQSHLVGSYRSALRTGLGYVPEERRMDGVALTSSVEDNLASRSLRALRRNGLVRSSDVRRLARQLAATLSVKTRDLTQNVLELSGGNQQKVALGKWLAAPLTVLLLDEPTRGVDVGAKQEIHDLIRQIADDGTTVVFVSSDLPELLALSDRIVVMKDGDIVGELVCPTTEEHVMRVATGLEGDAA
jgi:ABC-type sugar transport system ATPase subunit